MKKKYLITALLLVTIISGFAQSQFYDNHMKWTRDWTNFEPNNTHYPEYDQILPKIISEDTYLRNDIVYLMSGDIYVVNNAKLTIQEGTILRADTEHPANLVISRGAKLIANGSKAYPIVFTSNKSRNSRKSGDWGGITIIGSGNTNTINKETNIKGDFDPLYTSYGGENEDEETTILRYVRVEYAGKSSNGLSLYALGKKSIIENVMVSFSADDSFEWNGGATISKNLVSLKSNDDDFDFTQGYKGELTNIIAIRHPYITSNNGSYAIEIDGYHNRIGFENTTSLTSVDITGATIITLADQSNFSHTRAAISVNNLAELYINDSNISGFSDVVKLDKTFSTLRMIEQGFKMDNSFFNVHKGGVITQNKIKDDINNLLKYNRFTKTFQSPEEVFSDPLDKGNPDFRLKKPINNYMVIQ
ncbi:hypothetical protein [Aquimarina sp. 2201CG5-10]|uniref:hypothetical protein n=1 Tax=Aquimarina callyspongiae TaxID=3098150 RepID=UPI002AB5CA68|nr:hypothetical protein [Aquimarina sp. 2201CG5-10]MDY8136648.1 hypothetical protein [Aquimarina sp. 2201CG5-10]